MRTLPCEQADGIGVPRLLTVIHFTHGHISVERLTKVQFQALRMKHEGEDVRAGGNG